MTERKPIRGTSGPDGATRPKAQSITVTIDPSWWDEPIEDDYADRRNWCEWCARPDQECVCP